MRIDPPPPSAPSDSPIRMPPATAMVRVATMSDHGPGSTDVCDHVIRTLTDLPVVGHPTRMHVRIPRFTCNDRGCDVSVFRQRINRVLPPKVILTRRAAPLDPSSTSPWARCRYPRWPQHWV